MTMDDQGSFGNVVGELHKGVPPEISAREESLLVWVPVPAINYFEWPRRAVEWLLNSGSELTPSKISFGRE
jgi:hypothetical protein